MYLLVRSEIEGLMGIKVLWLRGNLSFLLAVLVIQPIYDDIHSNCFRSQNGQRPNCKPKNEDEEQQEQHHHFHFNWMKQQEEQEFMEVEFGVGNIYSEKYIIKESDAACFYTLILL
jgi:hypothetical protein